MLKALWFLARITLLVAAIVWLLRHPGTVRVDWLGYAVDTSVGFAAAALLFFLALWTWGHGLWRGLAATPRALARARAMRLREKGYRSLTSGLVAVAAGDARGAEKHARLSKTLIPDAPLTMLLDAQALLLAGNAPRARIAFAGLLEDQNAAFLGVRGLLQEAIESGDLREALQYARKARDLEPSRAWVARTLFSLEARNGQWRSAENALKSCARLGVFPASEVNRHRQALLLARAGESFAAHRAVEAHKTAAKAFALDPAFTPAALLLARFYTHVGKTGAAAKTLLKAYAAGPHPALAQAWMEGGAAGDSRKNPYDRGKAAYARAQKLFDLDPGHAVSLRLMGAAALDAGKFREARDFLARAGDYRGLARLEMAESADNARAREWLEMAAEQPPAPHWNCNACGHAAEEWAPLCRHCGAFNALSWSVPATDAHTPQKARMDAPGNVLSLPG